MTDDLAQEKSAGVILDAAEHEPPSPPLCQCGRPATYISGGVPTCETCLGSREPAYIQRTAHRMNRWMPVVLALFSATVAIVGGCAKRDTVVRESVMDRYYREQLAVMRQLDAKAIEDTLAKIDQLDEAQTRDHLATGLKASPGAARMQAGAALAEIEAAEFADEWTREKAKALYGQWLKEIRAHE